MLQWPVLGALLAMLSSYTGAAATGAYTNNQVTSYPGTVAYPPVIDATNFINNNQFIINFTTFSLAPPYYETSDTVNYTNNALMMANTGFQFDTQFSGGGDTNRVMAGNFYNPGTISCGSVNDLEDPFLGSLYLFGYYPQCLVNATNIVNPGIVDMGVDGKIQFTGQKVNLNHSTLTFEGAGANAFGSGIFGLNTNYWDPSVFLGPNYAESAFFPIPPFYLYLPNSTAYFNFAAPSTNYNIIRAVFIEDTSGPDVTYNVYFDTAGVGFGSGNVTVEWVGSYQDAASGNFYSSYLYLNDNYILGSSTNVFLTGNGYPDNFTFTESPTKLIFQTPAPAGFYNVFPAGSISNRYAFANVQLLSSTATTNSVANYSVTNLPGRLEINASKDLDLNRASISGPNYTSIQSPHQFQGSAGARILSAYSDINVGVTNGFLTVSNLMQPVIPNWSGTCQAWSTRWLTLTTNIFITGPDTNGVVVTNLVAATNDFRVLIVGSQLSPSTLAEVQDLMLHGTNSIVISDRYNVMRTFTADAQNLTLTTNGIGNGATSPDGELNLGSVNVFWADSLPNLRNLTNNGAIRLQNLSHFIGSSGNVVITPPVAATGTLSAVNSALNMSSGNKVVVGTNQYVFVNTLTNATPNQVKIGGQFDGSMSNLIAAINRVAGAGTNYSTSTMTNAQVFAGPLISHAFTVTAKDAGTSGNSIITPSTTATNLIWSGSRLSGGADGTTNGSVVSVPYNNFINRGLVSDQGSIAWVNNFVSGGAISNGVGSFVLQSLTTTLTNGSVTADGDISITADSLVTSNLSLTAGRSLTLQVTNLLTDCSLTNGSVWVAGISDIGPGGVNLPFKPFAGDLLGTTITNIAQVNRDVVNVWAATNDGASTLGFTNNTAVGRLILDAMPNPLDAYQNGEFTFTGVGVSNALYVDYLELRDAATNRDGGNNFPALNINSNMVVYYAQAVMNGVSVAAQMDHKNNDHLRWVPQYAGQFSSVQIIYPDGTTNSFNAALASDPFVDSDGDGIPNAGDPTPFFTVGQMNTTTYVTNIPPQMAVIQWDSIPASTNIVTYSTNMATWFPLTNFVSPATVPPVGGWPITNIVFDPVVSPMRFYNVTVIPNSTTFYGP